jgi:hypothetical protein
MRGKMKLENIRFLHAVQGDWVGVYVNKKLVMQGHRVDANEVLEYIFPELDIKKVWTDFDQYHNMCPQIYPDDLE